MRSLNVIACSVALILSLWGSAVWSESPSHRIESAQRAVDAIQSLRRENDQLKFQIEEMAERVKMIDRSRLETIEVAWVEKEEILGALENARDKWAAAMAEAEQLRSSLRAAERRIAEAERLLSNGSTSALPEVQTWLRNEQAHLPSRADDPFYTPRPREIAKKNASHVLKEATDVDFLDTPLHEALDYWSEFHSVDIVLDEELAKSKKETLLNGRVIDMTLADALLRYLKPLGMSYRSEGSVIYVEQRR